MRLQNIPQISHADSNNFFLLSGPCAIEGEDMAMRIAEVIVKVTDELKIPYVFKGSFKKANRSRADSFTGIGDEKALKILRKVSETFKVPTITDIHEVSDADMAAEYVDVLQIPAFLVRQTDLVVAAAETGKTVNLKKGQFMSPESMKHAVNKVKESDNENVWITDRGTMFGYQDMIVDFRGVPTMKQYAPVVLDVTHSLQQPNQASGVTGGRPELINTMARAGIAAGVDGIFMETHFDPANAKSDGANMLDLKMLPQLLKNLTALRQTINSLPSLVNN
ncbi:3-deoxy-8-phosphooctulonate synthase [Euzebyella marina]|uniref:3-deoxy-8-phosphooctulonate synthase n=1 Tax=Euzebyella marina TaxID=1761453 RepID=A0A3G2L9K4_9FLAO|nr:3-deoxy-8-phosphooctulonate synthase [Euzebyella marina]AYN68881.1 3-deoxy-8-phosphooctulonate synthase [Euzebyella marina]